MSCEVSAACASGMVARTAMRAAARAARVNDDVRWDGPVADMARSPCKTYPRLSFDRSDGVSGTRPPRGMKLIILERARQGCAREGMRACARSRGRPSVVAGGRPGVRAFAEGPAGGLGGLPEKRAGWPAGPRYRTRRRERRQGTAQPVT